eukprot:903132-Pyramimonas_sp.AAC.1
MVEDKVFMRALLSWGRSTRVTNMHLERLLALMLANSGRATPPYLERYCGNGILCQYLKEHALAGGRSPGCDSAASLKDEGVLTMQEVFKKQEGDSRGGVRAWQLFAASKRGQRAKGTLSEYHSWLSAMATEFNNAPPAEQADFHRKAERANMLKKAAILAQRSENVSSNHLSESFKSDLDCSRLWGMVSHERPISEDHFLAGAPAAIA